MKHALLLDDSRIGNSNQVRAFAKFLAKENHQIDWLKLEFSFMIFLPNIINYYLGTGVKNYKNLPKNNLIISSGRRSALAASLIKKKDRKVKVLQLMRPSLPAKYFDFIATPKHDRYKKSDYEFLFAPSLVKVNIDKSKVSENIISVMIGGDTKKNKVSVLSIENLCSAINKIDKKYQINILTSRRTGSRNELIIKSNLSNRAKIYDWNSCKNHNPYLDLLAQSSYLIVTTDSISMISDAVSTGKTTYIYADGFGDKKHKNFVKNIILGKYAKYFSIKLGRFRTKKILELGILEDLLKKKIL